MTPSHGRKLAWIAAAFLILVGGYASTGPPRLGLANGSIVITYPGARSAGAFAAAIGAVVLAGAVSRLWTRVAWGVLGATGLAAGLHLLAFRVTADEHGLVTRGLLGRTSLAWSTVSRVDSGPGLVVVRGDGDDALRIDTTDFTPDQRAVLDRTIARHVQEAGARALPR